MSVPVKSAVVEIDPATGKGRRNVAFATDTTEGILTIAPDGRMFATPRRHDHDVTRPGRTYVDPYLPEGLEVIKPTGGLNGFVPVR
ncbi:hypothetical protein [Rhodococcus sp. BE178]|uniref:hypothetical protein n=1 Tax=Rhodococcus sp. BE178 TaxID=2817737 RepID=UPI003D1EA3EE